ncbi:xanthine dehydrogenase family protein molybdopterin-binding subunit [Pseudoroseomonas wenyumeiae]|uniref:Xanthine dehydrogenase family protein molybdopterin-binding subunit n=1 Tax=Teichococcus wenyumeiae TaxID=2478470 RepID=A0A3A9J8S9_9PROT|nr:xanthine dehydrogenase family protein molybdopterin-binding subunit [Pseudoroseomonas wenyumeiae]RKK01941.1 xanthine dehydrogenase family protein molybdopterin-binding subunit [Pseudoroseomonas wenyumeiae]RMI20164.1 xanthine dehydrogenase family protein molybdopterin-binding subunit [Pseudoroseomonas wenyumeiae]
MTYIGTPRSRVDGRAKVTGAARYAGEFTAPDLAHGYIVSSAVAKGRVLSVETEAARALPGVLEVFTHENRPGTAWLSGNYQDEVAPPGAPFRPLYDSQIQFSGQPVALVVAEDFDTARDAASLIRVTYEAYPHQTDLHVQRAKAYVPSKKRDGIDPPPPPRGDADAALAAAPVSVRQEYSIAPEHHNPMEPHASTVIWEGEGKITVHDKIQGAQNSHNYITNVFGLAKENVRVLSPYVGGAFGSGLRPHHQLALAVMASLALKRSVRVSLTRDQMFALGYRPMTINTMALGADADGGLRAVQHEAVASTSTYEDYQEAVVNWSGLAYRCDNVKLGYKLAQLDAVTPLDMRAPGAPLGMFALESAMDELSYKLKMDPLELRLRNYAEIDGNTGHPFTSKELRAAYRQGAERFGWSRRNPEPRSMKEGRELIGWGMATGIWEAQMQQTSARATLMPDGTLEVATATADIGTGTYTILAQIAADAMGLAMEQVMVRIGDSSLPTSPVEGGSWTAASAGSAVQAVCYKLRDELLNHARSMPDSPLANASLQHVTFTEGRIALRSDPARFVTYSDAMRAGGHRMLSLEQTTSPDPNVQKTYSSYTHAAVFVEVRVDEELGVMRVTRVVDAVAAGKILNPKTARSQIIGGVVWGIGMALEEETFTDHALGRFMNHNLAEYHVPVNADIHEIDVIFVEEEDDKTSPLGVKGLGEIGIVGTAAAIANAVFHATGKRIRDLPITIDKVIG